MRPQRNCGALSPPSQSPRHVSLVQREGGCLPSDRAVAGSSAVNSNGRWWVLWVCRVRRTGCRWCSGTDPRGRAGSGRWNMWNTAGGQKGQPITTRPSRSYYVITSRSSSHACERRTYNKCEWLLKVGIPIQLIHSNLGLFLSIWLIVWSLNWQTIKKNLIESSQKSYSSKGKDIRTVWYNQNVIIRLF